MYGVEMLTRKAGIWVTNERLFPSWEGALAEAQRLAAWSFVVETRIVPHPVRHPAGVFLFDERVFTSEEAVRVYVRSRHEEAA